MNNAPYSYAEINQYNGTLNPSTVHIRNTATHFYFRKYLLQRAMGVFKWTLPKSWSKRYFLYTLYNRGYVAVVNTDKFGIIPQACGLQGFNVFYEPTHAIIQNPLFRPTTAQIGTQTELIRLQPDYSSAMDIINSYADKLTLAFQAIDINLVNSHVCTVFFAQNKSAAESYKKMFDSISSGNPAVVLDSKMLDAQGNKQWEMWNRDIKNSYLVSDLLEDVRKIMNMFDNIIGIHNANTEKKERQIVDEVNANNEETENLRDVWFGMLKEDLEKVRAMFGYSTADLNIEMKGGDSDEQRGNAFNPGAV